MKLDAQLLTLLIGVVIPFASHLFTKEFARAKWITLVDAILAAATGVLVTAQATGGIITKQAATAALLTFVTAQASHYGVFDSTDLGSWVSGLLPKFGLGAKPVAITHDFVLSPPSQPGIGQMIREIHEALVHPMIVSNPTPGPIITPTSGVVPFAPTDTSLTGAPVPPFTNDARDVSAAVDTAIVEA